MKGQLSIVFYVSFIIFITFILYLAFQIQSQTFPPYKAELKMETLKSEAYQISELLINDPGEPSDWNEGNVKRLGLSTQQNLTNILSTSKISKFKSICENNGFAKLQNLLDSSNQFYVVIKDMDTENILVNTSADCPPAIVGTEVTVEIERIVALDSGSYGTLRLIIW